MSKDKREFMANAINIEEFKSDYLLTLEDHLNGLETQILSLEDKSEEDISSELHELFRKVHSYKGSSGSYEFYMLTTILHRFEDLLNAQVEHPLMNGFVDLCLKYIDLTKNCLADYQKE